MYKIKIKEKLKGDSSIYILLYIVMLIITALKNVNFADDLYFADFPNITGVARLIWFIPFRYEVWTSRILIEVALVVCTRYMSILWRILDPVLYVMLAYGIKEVFLNKSKHKNIITLVICMLVFLIPQFIFTTAGWRATSINYLWPTACGVISLIPIRKKIDNKKIGIFEFIIYMLITLFAANSEQVALVLATVYTLFLIYFIKEKKIDKKTVILWMIIILSLIFVLTCPGNSQRAKDEVTAFYLDYYMVNLIDKILIGLWGIKYYIFNFNIIYFLFVVQLMINCFRKYDSIFIRILSIIPVFMGCAFNVFGNITQQIFPQLYDMILSLKSSFNIISFENCMSPANYIPIIIVILNIGLLFILTYIVFGNNKKSIIAILILGAGICSQFVMGFLTSASMPRERTQLIMMVSMISLIAMMYEKLSDKELKKYVNILSIISIFYFIENVIFVLKIGRV